MMNEKLDQIIQDLELIKKSLKIVPDKDATISNFDSSIKLYEEYAKEELNLGKNTIENQKSSIAAFLNHSKGVINKDSVKHYLASNDSVSWKSNQLKALRRYIRDFLKLGRWIEGFEFEKTKAKLKELPSDQALFEFFDALPYQAQLVFLVLYNSGLRIGEVLKLKVDNIDFKMNMIDATEIHSGDTKSSWISFITTQTAIALTQHIQLTQGDSLFSKSERSVQNAFKSASEYLGYNITPHLLRTVFTEKCTQAGILDKYINAFCGRIPQGVLAKHYTDYSPAKLREQYNKVEPYLVIRNTRRP